MVKGITRQVVVVKGPDPKLFDQAIFLVREDAASVSEEALLQEARQVAQSMGMRSTARPRFQALLWGSLGAGVTGLLWLLTALL